MKIRNLLRIFLSFQTLLQMMMQMEVMPSVKEHKHLQYLEIFLCLELMLLREYSPHTKRCKILISSNLCCPKSNLKTQSLSRKWRQRSETLNQQCTELFARLVALSPFSSRFVGSVPANPGADLVYFANGMCVPSLVSFSPLF